jgi:hypothetical protein
MRRKREVATRYTPDNLQDCKKLAEDNAGPSEHGYLYRLYWSRSLQSIRLVAYPILKITPMCFKIQPKIHNKPMYVSQIETKQRYACSKLDMAVASYKARRQSMVRICERRLRDAEESLAAIDPMDPKALLYWLQDEEKVDDITTEEQDEVNEYAY